MAINPFLQGIGATFGGQAQAPDTDSPKLRSQADDLRAKQLQQLSGPTQPPQVGGNGFGLIDVLALLGAAASGRHADKFLGSYLETKQQAQAQRQQAALQQWGDQQQQQMNLANVYGQQANALDKRADQTAQDAIDKTRYANQFLGQRLDSEAAMKRAGDAIAAKKAAISQTFANKSQEELVKIALNAGDPSQRETASQMLLDTYGVVVTPPKTTGEQQKIGQGAAKVKQGEERVNQGWKRITDQEARNAPAIAYQELVNKWYPKSIQSQIDAREAAADRSRELTARGGASGGSGKLDNQTKTALKYQIGTWEMERMAAKKVLSDVKSGVTANAQGPLSLGIASAALKRLGELEANLFVAKQKLEGKRPLAGDGIHPLPGADGGYNPGGFKPRGGKPQPNAPLKLPPGWDYHG
jgi:hypothetical protein